MQKGAEFHHSIFLQYYIYANWQWKKHNVTKNWVNTTEKPLQHCKKNKENWTINPTQTEHKSPKFNANKPSKKDGEEVMGLPVTLDRRRRRRRRDRRRWGLDARGFRRHRRFMRVGFSHTRSFGYVIMFSTI